MNIIQEILSSLRKIPISTIDKTKKQAWIRYSKGIIILPLYVKTLPCPSFRICSVIYYRNKSKVKSGFKIKSGFTIGYADNGELHLFNGSSYSYLTIDELEAIKALIDEYMLINL
jgi:hypothetical protein